ncbi:MAG TPA: hypothetical protein PKY63_09065 [Bacteroidales bacterium]|nr:hypothetical protein [Bacteroidales bacterium]
MKWLFLLSALIPVLSGNAQTDSVKKKEFVAELFFQMNPSSRDGFSLNQNSNFSVETGAKIRVKKSMIMKFEDNLFICLAFKKNSINWHYVNEIFTASYLNFGVGYSIDFRLSKVFSLSIVDELLYNHIINATETNPNNRYFIDYTDRALQNKLGLAIYWNLSKNCSFGISPKIAPCIRLSPRKYGSISHMEYYVSVLDDGWPFYLGTSLMIKL